MSFRSNALAMLTGTVFAQAIPLILSPVLARLYSPDAFGLQTLVMGITTICVVPATLRLDLAMVLSPDDGEAKDIAAVILAVTMLMVAVFCLIALGWGQDIASALGHPGDAFWISILPLLTISVVLFQVLSAFASRTKRFRPIATGNVINQVSYILSALALGAIASGWTLGLSISKLIGQAAGTIGLLREHGRDLFSILRHFDLSKMLRATRRYWQFLVFNTPYSLIGSLSREAPILIFSATGAVSAAGLYGMARTIVLAPTLLISNALSQVYYREAVALKGTVRLHDMTVTLIRTGLLVTAAPFAFCAAWGGDFFSVVFGATWREAGVFAMVLAPAAWVSTQTGWPERLFEVNGRQGVSFTVQIIADTFMIAALAAVLVSTSSPFWGVVAYAVSNAIYQFAYLISIFRISQFPLRKLTATIIWSILVFALFYLVFMALKAVSGASLVSGISAIVIAAVAALVIAWNCRKDVVAFTEI